MFGGMDAQSVYGVTPQSPSWGAASPTQAMGTDVTNAHGWKGLVDPDNPLMWFGLILLVTAGAAGVAGSVRLGPAKLSGSVGS